MNVAHFLSTYRRFFALPDVKGTLIVTLLSRMPVGMMGLSMLMFLREALGSFKIAGLILGIYLLSSAVAAPVQGRIIDRQGPLPVLRITGWIEPLVFAAFIATGWLQGPLVALILLAMLMGIFSPPITVVSRTLWRHRFEKEEDRHLAFSVDSVLIEMNFTIGPALIGMILAFYQPRIGILATWVAITSSIIIFLHNPALKYWRQEESGERHLLGPLTDLRLLLLFIIVFGLAAACGLLEVGYPAYASFCAVPAFAGVLLSLNSLGSAIGGGLFGALHSKRSIEQQFAILLGVFALPLLLHALIDQPVYFAIIAFLAGLMIAPAFATQAVIVSRIAPAKYATEAFTWASTFIVCGLGAGSAAGGVLAETVHIKAPFVAAGTIMLLMSLTAMLLKKPRQENRLLSA